MDPQPVADAFDLGRVRHCELLKARTGMNVHSVTTDRGRYVVKEQLDTWRDKALMGMEFEQRAVAAGLPMPAIVHPRNPAFGVAARVGDRHFRVHLWLQHTQPGDSDASAWLGGLLARMHRLQPVPAASPEPWTYGEPDHDRWADWEDRGRSADQVWALPLRRRLALLGDVLARLRTAFTQYDTYGVAHPDVEPQNVFFTARGWMLVDWDFAAPDSLPLQLAHAALVFATVDGEPEPRRISRTVSAYSAAGGVLPQTTEGILSRRLGMMLSRMGERIRMTLGDEPANDEPAEIAAHVARRLDELPDFCRRLERWERSLPFR